MSTTPKISSAKSATSRHRGNKTAAELRELARKVQCAQPNARLVAPPQERSAPFAPGVGDSLSIPVSIRDLEFGDLPMSHRLEGVLGLKRLTRLGDLHGMSVRDLGAIRNCGNKTMAEMLRLILRAAAGEFKTITEAGVAWSPAELVKFLDALVAELPVREAKVLKLRFIGKNGQMLTLQAVGSKFNLSRERIRQIVEKSKARLQRAGSRRLRAYLRHLERACRESACPLTPALLERRLGEKISKLRFSPAFYVRLLCELCPALSAKPDAL